MSKPVRAYHLIITVYGFWLPNDPRGSWSDYVRSWELFRFAGPATTTQDRLSLARKDHDWRHRQQAKTKLVCPPVHFTGLQARAVGAGFKHYVQKSGIVIHACSIMSEHVHMVIARHDYSIEQIANLLKGAATAVLGKQGLHPFAANPYKNGKLPTPWTRKQWSKFLTYDSDIIRAIGYVNDNPLKEGKPAQKWSFVSPFGP